MADFSHLDADLIVSREALRRYQLEAGFMTPEGRLAAADLGFLRRLAQHLNQARDVARSPERGLSAGQLNGFALLEGALLSLLRSYRSEHNPGALAQALSWLGGRFGPEAVDRMLARFIELYPVPGFDPAEQSWAEFLEGTGRDGSPHREHVLERVLILFFVAENPAFSPLRELFDDSALDADTGYREMIASLGEFFSEQAGFGPEERPLFELLRDPMRAAPASLREQLEHVARGDVFAPGGSGGGQELDHGRWLVGVGVLREEEKPPFVGGPGPPAEVQLPNLSELSPDLGEERYSEDRGWMQELVLVAKSCYVWLDQLARRYERDISRLDEVPDEELDTLAARGITGLWLIGIWERSRASERIKRLCGNPDAAASAYSLYDIRIADRLGGEPAYEDLRDRARQRGIRLACDMVPNHTGIDSRWVVEHPEWFLSLPECPFPNYSFTGPDLSSDPRVGVFLEDHYYDRTDAAVVFQRLDRETGEKRYIYHGNDGTSLPWNDTAQLDYLNPEAREAVIETILEVARRFQVIRFDAAMTLAKRHIHRLWFPEPGKGGDIPTRAEHGLTGQELDRHMPEEFWREVVDRVAAEVPDTLLLAEAFWMMENYFVRTLGMHRVYNSAFMHMLRDEDNEKFRNGLKQTLEFDPAILQRYVNFLTNPDEETAIEQFGKGDKYFGVCLTMATLPGLPMFGHGQFEGFWEKYGMEYQRAYKDERPDLELVARHEREIVPLLLRRALFAEVENFRLFDFDAVEGHVAHDVIAFANRRGGERAIVIYHNRYGTVRGSIHFTVPFRDKAFDALRRESLSAVLGLSVDDDSFCLYRDSVSGLEFIRSTREIAERGLFVALGAHERRVLLDFRAVRDGEAQQYRRLAESLHNHGVPSVEEALRELVVQAVRAPVFELIHAETLRRLVAATERDEVGRRELLDEVEARLAAMFEEIAPLLGTEPSPESLPLPESPPLPELSTVEQMMATPPEDEPASRAGEVASGVRATFEAILAPDLEPVEPIERARLPALLAWAILRDLGRLLPSLEAEEIAAASRTLIDEWLLAKPLPGVLTELGLESAAAQLASAAVTLFVGRQGWHREVDDEGELDAEIEAETEAATWLEGWLADEEVQRFLGVNRFDDVLWFQGEAFHELLAWLAVVAKVEVGTAADPAELERCLELVSRLGEAEKAAGYRVDTLLDLLAPEAEPEIEAVEPEPDQPS